MMQEPVVPMCFMRVRCIGVMHMIDQGERDDKIIAVHIDDPEYKHITEISEVPKHRLAEIRCARCSSVLPMHTGQNTRKPGAPAAAPLTTRCAPRGPAARDPSHPQPGIEGPRHHCVVQIPCIPRRHPLCATTGAMRSEAPK